MKRFGILLDIQPVEYLENSVLSSRLARDNDKLISYSAKTCQQTKLSNAGRQPRPGPGWVQDSLSLKEFLLSGVTGDSWAQTPDSVRHQSGIWSRAWRGAIREFWLI